MVKFQEKLLKILIGCRRVRLDSSTPDVGKLLTLVVFSIESVVAHTEELYEVDKSSNAQKPTREEIENAKSRTSQIEPVNPQESQKETQKDRCSFTFHDEISLLKC